MKRAFTLIELLVVLALLSLLVSLVGPSGKKMYERFSKRMAEIERVGEAHDREFIFFLNDKNFYESNRSE